MTTVLKPLKQVLREHCWLIGYVVAHALISYVVLNLTLGNNYSFETGYAWTMFRCTWQASLIMWVYHSIYIVIAVRPERPVSYQIEIYKKNIFTVRTITSAVLIIGLMTLFTCAYSTFKAIIPFIVPYSWDETFAHMDRVLHFGIDPWKLVHPVIGYPIVTFAINIAYNLWLVVMYIFWLWLALDLKNRFLRMRFFLTYVIVWSLMGNIAALYLSSAGPAYYSRILGETHDYYEPLMQYLRSANEIFPECIWALFVQDFLWDRYVKHSIDIGSGISAMPSMHVSMAYLFAVIGWAKSRWLGIAFTIYAVMIMVGSFHLAWHYAIDGYVGIAGTWAAWKFSGWFLKRDPFFNDEKTN